MLIIHTSRIFIHFSLQKVNNYMLFSVMPPQGPPQVPPHGPPMGPAGGGIPPPHGYGPPNPAPMAQPPYVGGPGGGPPPHPDHHHRGDVIPQLSEQEFEDIMSRNRTVSSSAIGKKFCFTFEEVEIWEILCFLNV